MTPRILWMIIPACQPRTAGSATYAKILIPYLLNRPSVRSIVVVAETAIGGKLIERDGRCTFFRIIPDPDKFQSSASIIHWTWQKFSMGMAQLIFSVFLLTAFFRRSRSVVYVHDAYARHLIPILIKLFGLDAICDVRDPFFIPKSVMMFPTVIACSMNLAGLLSRHLPVEKISHVPVPLDLEALHRLATNALPPSIPVERDYILYLGRSSPQKGVYELIEAHSQLCAAVPSPPALVLAGRVLISDAQAIAKAHPRIFFVGEVAWDAVPGIISKARLVILPSRGEGLPRAILEAVALGIPVLCPPGITEFDHYCPQCVISEISSTAIFEALMRQPGEFIAREYPICEHDAPNCLARTASIMGL
jgi:glycosyltransferase involved in cell wall biosynthesis